MYIFEKIVCIEYIKSCILNIQNFLHYIKIVYIECTGLCMLIENLCTSNVKKLQSVYIKYTKFCTLLYIMLYNILKNEYVQYTLLCISFEKLCTSNIQN